MPKLWETDVVYISMSPTLMTKLYYEFKYDNFCVGFHTTEFLSWLSPGVEPDFVRKLVFHISTA